MNKLANVTAWTLGSILVITAGVTIVNTKIVASVDTTTLAQASQYQNGKFHNIKAFGQPGFKKTLEIFKRYFTEPAVDKVPTQAIPMERVTRAQLDALSNDDLHFVKLGHSSVL